MPNDNDRVPPDRRPSGALAPPPRVALAVRGMIDRLGETEAVRTLGVSRNTVVRIAGRLPCRRGSILFVATRLGIDLEGHQP